MKFLTKLILENFQSHKYSIIEFNQGLNVIVGPSDTGKSAIIRAIKWALYNEPAGDYFIREGEIECSVTLEFNDKTRIKRFRNRSKNAYFLYDKYGNEIKFEGFGTSVPQEIIDEIGIEKIHLDSDESKAINLGEQLEGPFLLAERSSIRASAIGRLIGVNIIDDALKDTLRDLRNSSTMKKSIDENIELLKTEIKNYDYLEELSQRVNKIEKIKNQIKYKNLRLKELKKIEVEYDKVQVELKSANIYLNNFRNIGELDKILKDISYLYNKYKYFNRKKDDITKNRVQINNSTDILNRLNKVNNVEGTYKNLISIYKKMDSLVNIEKKLSLNKNQLNIVENLNIKLKDLSSIENNTILIEKNIQKLLDLSNLVDKFENNQRNISIGTIYIKNLENVDEIFSIYTKLEMKLRNLYKYQDLLTQLLRCHRELDAENKIIVNTKKSIDLELEKYRDLLKKLEVCPLCFSSIDNEKIQHIIQHYN